MTWQTDILDGISAPKSPNNINKLTAWTACELPGLRLYNNPFNTTLPASGSYTVVVLNAQGGGVQKYPTLAIGIQATVDTLLHSSPAYGYSRIVNNLRNDGDQQVFAQAVGSTPWGTSGSCIASAVVPGKTGGATTSGSNPPPPNYEGMVTFTYAQLQGLWIAAGGNPQTAAMAGAIAMAESGGNAQATHTNSNGTIDRGLWQINSTNGSGSSTDVMTNVRTAISMSNNGQNWRPWCTAWNGGCCGCGTYLGSGAPYTAFYNPSVKPDNTVPLNSTSGATNPQTPAGYGTTAATAPATETGFNFWSILGRAAVCTTFPLECLGVQAATTKNPVESYIVNAITGTIFAMLNPFIQIIAGVGGMVAGGGMMIMSLYMIANQTETGHEAIGVGKKVAGAGLMLAAPEAAPEVAAAEAGGAAATRTWTTVKPAGPRSPQRTYQTTQTTTRIAGRTHTQTVREQLNEQAREHTNQPPPQRGWWPAQ